MENEVRFSSCFSQSLQNFVKEKQDLGYKYETECRILRHFDQYCILHCSTPVLCQELVQGYISTSGNRTTHTKRNIIGLMRQFAFYLIRNGHPAWVFPKELFPNGDQIYKPYIFTREEISLFLEKAEQLHPNPQFPTRHLTLPLLYRTLYCCGIRVSEAAGLTLGTVDLKNGILSIKRGQGLPRPYYSIIRNPYGQVSGISCSGSQKFNTGGFLFPIRLWETLQHSRP